MPHFVFSIPDTIDFTLPYREILSLKLAESEGEDFWVVGAFPNERSLIRLAVAILIDINEEWLTGRRYLDMEENSL